MKKKKWYFFIAGGGILLAGLMISFWNNGNTEWKKLCEVDSCKSMFENSITEMTLRETVDHPEWVEFKDEDLIEMWTSYFGDLEVKEYSAIFENEQSLNGGGRVVAVRTEQEEIVFVEYTISDEAMIKIDGILYKIKEKGNTPFEETYKIAVERYGIRSVFD